MNMKKNVLVILFLAVVLFIGSKAFIVLFSYQSAEKVKQGLSQEFAISYSWLSSELDGSIVLHDVSITPYRLKRTFYIERLSLNYGSYLNLLLNLPSLSAGEHVGLQSISAPSIKGLLEGRDLEEWIALEYGHDFSVPLGLYACGELTRVGHSDLRKMGITEFESSLMINKRLNLGSNELMVSLDFDMGSLGKAELKTTWLATSIPSTLASWAFEKFQLSALSLTHVEQGYFRRLSNYCSVFTKFDRQRFSLSASELWQKNLNTIGLEPGHGLKQLYRDYLLQGGQLSLELSPLKPFTLGDFDDLLDKNLMSYFGVSTKLNGKTVFTSELHVNAQHFRPPPPAKLLESKMNKPSEVKKMGYYPILLSELEQSFEKKVRIKMLGGKFYEGLVVSLDEQKLGLSQDVAGGSVVYSLLRSEIESLDMWR